jgi:hypothetical protein
MNLTEDTRKRRRRDSRLDNPPLMVLTERDKRVIEAVYRYRVLTQIQITKLFFTRPNTAQRRLSLLFDHEFLSRDFLPVRGGIMTSPILYSLGKQGARVLTQELGYTNIQIKSETKRTGQEFLEHLLAVNEFRITVTLACEQFGFPIHTWLGQHDMRANPDKVTIQNKNEGTTQQALIPDSYFVIQVPQGTENKKAYFFLEYDRGTEPLDTLKQKVRMYSTYIESGGYENRYGTKAVRILMVAQGKQRVRNLKKLTETIQPSTRFWFAALPDLKPENVFTEPIWYVAGREEQVALISL